MLIGCNQNQHAVIAFLVAQLPFAKKTVAVISDVIAFQCRYRGHCNLMARCNFIILQLVADDYSLRIAQHIGGIHHGTVCENWKVRLSPGGCDGKQGRNKEYRDPQSVHHYDFGLLKSTFGAVSDPAAAVKFSASLAVG